MEQETGWEPGDVPSPILESLEAWAAENVAEAIRHYWEDDPPVACVDESESESGHLLLIVYGPEKPERNKRERIDSYKVEIDLMAELEHYGLVYPNGPISEVQRVDLTGRIAKMKRWASEIAALAVRMQEQQ